MSRNEDHESAIDWRLTTWVGARREALRRWARLPLEQVIAALEEMGRLSEALENAPPREVGDRAVAEDPSPYDPDAHSRH